MSKSFSNSIDIDIALISDIAKICATYIATDLFNDWLTNKRWPYIVETDVIICIDSFLSFKMISLLKNTCLISFFPFSCFFSFFLFSFFLLLLVMVIALAVGDINLEIIILIALILILLLQFLFLMENLQVKVFL